MKKKIGWKSILIVTLVVSLFSMQASAAAAPSVTSKQAPGIVTRTNDSGEVYYGMLTAADGTPTYVTDASAMTITPLSTVDNLTAEKKAAIEAAYAALNGKDTDGKAALDTALNDKLAAAGRTADDYTASDIFDLTATDDIEAAVKAGGSLEVALENKYEGLKDGDVLAAKYDAETKSFVFFDDPKVSTDYITLSVTHFCPVVLFTYNAVDKSNTSSGNAQTGDTTNTTMLWVVLGTAVVAGVAVGIILYKKRAKR